MNVALRFRAINQRKVDFKYSITPFCVGKALLIAYTFMAGQVIAPALAEIQFKFVVNSRPEFYVRLRTLIWIRSRNWNLDNSPKKYGIKRCEYTNRLQMLRTVRKSQKFATLYTKCFEIFSFKGSEVKYREFHIFVTLVYSSAILTASYAKRGGLRISDSYFLRGKYHSPRFRKGVYGLSELKQSRFIWKTVGVVWQWENAYIWRLTNNHRVLSRF